MKRCVFLAVLQLGLLLTPAGRAAADDLPAEAKEEIDQFRREAARIDEDAEAKIAAKKADLVKRLRTLQTKYTKEGKLDEAVAIRDRVRLLEGGNDVPSHERVGKDCVRRVARLAVQYRVCQKVEVEWGGSWWAAEVLKVRGNQYYIHYTGWSCSWDEWVSECRIRLCGPCGPSHRR
jgi:RNA binding activity-knot of a chromodomain